METKVLRKYNSEYRKNLKHKIEKLNNKTSYYDIYKIINMQNDNKVSINRSGIYINLNALNDDIIEKLTEYLNEVIITENNDQNTKIIYQSYTKEPTIEDYIIGPKLSNQERNLIKKFRLQTA
jgi:hypothetical protein